MSARRRDRSGRNAGFTLLEMLVAVAILAILVAIVPRTLVSARGLLGRSEAWLEARLVAETLLNEKLVGNAVKEGRLRGEMNGLRWTAVLEPNGALNTENDNGRDLFNVKVTVDVPPRDKLVIETMRIGASPS